MQSQLCGDCKTTTVKADCPFRRKTAIRPKKIRKNLEILRNPQESENFPKFLRKNLDFLRKRRHRQRGCLIIALRQPLTVWAGGACRLTVGDEVKFACIDGPEFDGFKVDFDEAMSRGGMYKEFERHAYEEACNLFAQKA